MTWKVLEPSQNGKPSIMAVSFFQLKLYLDRKIASAKKAVFQLCPEIKIQ